MSKSEMRPPIYVNEEQAHTRLAHEAGKSKSTLTIERGVESLINHRKIMIASIGIVFAIAATWFIRESTLYEQTDDAHVDGRIIPLSARITGQVQQVTVMESQVVHVGDVLAVIDQKDYSIAVYQALANLAYAENTAASLYYDAAITVTSAYGRLKSAQATVKNAGANLVAAEGRLRDDEAVLKQVQTEFLNQRDNSGPATAAASLALVKSVQAVVAADQQVILQARGKLLEAVTNLREAQTAPQQVSLAKSNAQAADSQIMQRKAQLEQAQLNLNYTIMRSPVAGIVGKRRVEVGQNVDAGQELIDIVSLDDVWITANFKETQLGHLRLGQPVEIKVDAYGRTWKGHVTNLGGFAGSVVSATPPKDAIGKHVKVVQRIPVRIDFDRPQSRDFNADDLLKPGLSAEPRVRVRWLPRSGSPNKYSGSQGPTAGLLTP